VLKESTTVGAPTTLSAVADEVHRLWRSVDDHPWGQLSPSVYETARLVALAPWLRGHDQRLRFLVRTQRGDGRWGRGDAYGLVPTLSAVDAALAAAVRGDAVPPGLPWALDRGLAALHGWLRRSAGSELPDTPAIELIVPALAASVNARLAAAAAVPGLGHLALAGPLPATGPDVSAALWSGPAPPTKALHSLEVLGAPPGALRGFTPSPAGSVGASPAATAAWLAVQDPRGPAGEALRYLDAVVDRHTGTVPSVVPITTFERAWVASWLLDAGLPVPAPVAAGLAAGLGEAGAPGGPGLPPDADTTSVVIAVLGRLGREPDLDCLLRYDTGGHFATWAGERTTSVTTNAHVLDALGGRLARRPGLAGRYGSPRRRVVAWLCDQQNADGSWADKWHASPFYATACCVLALSRFGGPTARPAVARAVRWLLATQSVDGSWGRWEPTAEETAYAIHALTGRRNAVWDRPVAQAAARARAHLLARSEAGDEPSLWHDKDLYRPLAVVRAAVLAARQRSRRTVANGGGHRARAPSTVYCGRAGRTVW